MPLADWNVGVNQEVASIVLLRYSHCAWVVMDSALAGGICGRLKVHILSCLQLCSAEASWHYQGAKCGVGKQWPLAWIHQHGSRLSLSLPPPGEQVSWQRTSVCLTQPFPDVPFYVAMVGVRINPRKCWVSSLLVSLPTAHNSRSICTALPLSQQCALTSGGRRL